MNSDSLKWLIAGLAGSVLSLCLLGGGAFLAFRFAMHELENQGRDEVTPVYGPDDWRENEAKYNEKEAEKQARLEASGLLERYTPVSPFDDTRKQIFENHDFDLAETQLTAEFERADTPLLKHRYGQHIDQIGNLYYNEDPEAIWDTLGEWVEYHPESHLPYLIRGTYAVDYAWYFRGTRLANAVTSEAWDQFRHYLNIAREDLEKASTLNPDDPESSATLITVSAALNLGFGELDSYFAKTLAVDPLHYGARMTKMNFAQPKWGGSWEMLDELIADCDAHYEEFPLLAEVKRYGQHYMEPRGSAYEDTWNSRDTKWMMYAAYLAQSKMSPDDLRVQADLASFAADVLQFKEASDAMHRIGDQFPEGCRFSELPNYHRWRGISYAEYAAYPDVQGTPQEREFLDEARALDPSNSTVAGLYLGYLARIRDDARARAFYEALADPYLATGDWGEPPDYAAMEGMAKAGRSDDWGIQGTEMELPHLDEALALAPDNAFVRLVYAEHHITDKAYGEARGHLEKARELDPEYLPALHIMGWLNFHQERWDDGIACANQFLESGPSAYLTEFSADAREIIQLCEEKKQKAAPEI